MRRLTAAVALALVMSSCSLLDDEAAPVDETRLGPPTTPGDMAAGNRSSDPSSTTSTVPATAPDAPPADEAEGLVLAFDFVSNDAAIRLVSPSGSEQADVPTAPNATVWLPSWSPDATRLTWAEGSPQASWSLITADSEGGGRRTVPLSARPDHLAFGPDESLFVLGPGPGGFGLWKVAPDGTELTRLDGGSPYFIDIADDGRVVAHVRDELRLIAADGTVGTLDENAMGFQTPIWHPNQRSVLYARAAGDQLDDEQDRGESGEPQLNEIVWLDIATGQAEVLGRFEGFVFFDASADGARLAVTTFGPDPTAGIETQEAAYRATSAQVPAQDLLGTGLWLIDLTTGDARQLDSDQVGPPQFSPDGEWIIARDAVAGRGTWRMYDQTRRIGATAPHQYPRNSVTAYYQQLWDQFGRHQTLWAPDSRAFIYPGTVSGERGVWLQSIDLDQPAQRLADADVGFWSPRPPR